MWKHVQTCSKQCSKSLATTKFASSLTAKIYLLLAIQTLSNLILKRPCLLTLKKFFMNFFLLENLCFAFFVAVVYYTFL